MCTVLSDLSQEHQSHCTGDGHLGWNCQFGVAELELTRWYPMCQGPKDGLASWCSTGGHGAAYPLCHSAACEIRVSLSRSNFWGWKVRRWGTTGHHWAPLGTTSTSFHFNSFDLVPVAQTSWRKIQSFSFLNIRQSQLGSLWCRLMVSTHVAVRVRCTSQAGSRFCIWFCKAKLVFEDSKRSLHCWQRIWLICLAIPSGQSKTWR